MKMKKIIAGVAASALAVSAMAISASAAGPMKSGIKYFMTDGNGNYQMFLRSDDIGGNPYDIDFSKIDSFDVTLSWEGDEETWAGGAVVIQYESDGWWTQLGVYASDEEADRTWGGLSSGDTFNVKLPKSIPADEAAVILTFQNYADAVTINVDNVVVKDASGAVLADLAKAAAGTSADDNKEPATDDNNGAAGGDTNQTTPDKTNADTGVEGVAVVAGLAVIAAGAVVVAKKRK